MDAYTLTTQPNTDALADAEITGAGAAIEVAIFTVPVANATSRGPTRAAFAALVVPVESAAGVVAVSGAFRLTARTRAGEAEAAPDPAPRRLDTWGHGSHAARTVQLARQVVPPPLEKRDARSTSAGHTKAESSWCVRTSESK